MPAKYKLMYRLKDQLRSNPKFQSLYQKLIIHRQEWPKLPSLPGQKASYLLHILVHKSTVNIPRDKSGVYAIKHTKGLTTLKAKKIGSSQYLLDKFRFELKANSRSLRSLSFSFKLSSSLSHNLCTRVQINIFWDLKFLKNLESLSLSFAIINEEVMETLSNALLKTTGIKTLALNFIETPVNSGILASLKKSISKFRALAKVNIIFGTVNQSGEDPDFFSSLDNLTNLTTLSLETRRMLPPAFFDSLLRYLEKCTSPRNISLSLWNSFLTQKSISKVFEALGHLPLEQLIFGMNNLIDSESILSKLCTANFQNLKFLKFHLTNSKLTPQSFSYLGDSLPETLEVLNLKFKNVALHDSGIPSLLHNLIKLKKLEQLIIDLSLCSLDDEKFVNFIDYIPEKNNLKTFGISAEFNKLGDESLIRLANKLKKSRKLKELKLDLKGNSITNQAMSALVDFLRALNKLSYLSLDLQACQILSDSSQASLEHVVTENVSSLRHDPTNLLIAL